MKIQYQKGTLHTVITYGEILSMSIQQSWFEGKHVIILTNQRYYDRFFEKMEQLFLNQPVDWYIFRNQLYVNTLEEWSNLLAYLDSFSVDKSYLFVAFGSIGVIEMTGFLQKVSVLKGEFWSIPISFQSYAQSLVPECTIRRKDSVPILQISNLPRYIFLDQTMVAPQREGRLVDLQVFIRTAFLCDYPMLLQLFKQYPNPKRLQSMNFTALINEITRYYQESSRKIESYGRAFEEAFYRSENGHFLSENMKRFLGFILQVVWDQTTNKWPFQMEHFMFWLNQLGFPITFPQQISMAEYLENVLYFVGEQSHLQTLSKAGKLGEKKQVTEQELIEAFETYQQICRMIRSNEE